MINDKQSLRYANFVPVAPAQLPEEAIRMRVPNDVTMNNVTIGAIQKIRDLVTLQLHGTGLDAPASAPRVPHCHAGFPLTPPACARPPACGVFAATDGMPAPRGPSCLNESVNSYDERRQ